VDGRYDLVFEVGRQDLPFVEGLLPEQIDGVGEVRSTLSKDRSWYISFSPQFLSISSSSIAG